MTADHLLHAHVAADAMWLSLECRPDLNHAYSHASFDVEGPAMPSGELRKVSDECWVHDWLFEGREGCIAGDDWPADGPWPVTCDWTGDGLLIHYAGEAPSRECEKSDNGHP